MAPQHRPSPFDPRFRSPCALGARRRDGETRRRQRVGRGQSAPPRFVREYAAPPGLGPLAETSAACEWSANADARSGLGARPAGGRSGRRTALGLLLLAILAAAPTSPATDLSMARSWPTYHARRLRRHVGSPPELLHWAGAETDQGKGAVDAGDRQRRGRLLPVEHAALRLVKRGARGEGRRAKGKREARRGDDGLRH